MKSAPVVQKKPLDEVEKIQEKLKEVKQKLGEKGSDLLAFVNGLVTNFLTENPTTIKNTILDEWENQEVSDRLIFDTPIPLAEEQRKIISALNKKEGRFVTVEGPPGTGKSHTISAIAFSSSALLVFPRSLMFQETSWISPCWANRTQWKKTKTRNDIFLNIGLIILVFGK